MSCHIGTCGNAQLASRLENRRGIEIVRHFVLRSILSGIPRARFSAPCQRSTTSGYSALSPGRGRRERREHRCRAILPWSPYLRRNCRQRTLVPQAFGTGEGNYTSTRPRVRYLPIRQRAARFASPTSTASGARGVTRLIRGSTMGSTG